MKLTKFIILALIIIITPIVLFVLNFYNHDISKDIDDWASFGSFFSLIFSALSFTILAYITYILTKNSYLKPKQWDAYEELIKSIINLRLVFENVSNVLHKSKISTQNINFENNNNKKVSKAEIFSRYNNEKLLMANAFDDFKLFYIFFQYYEKRYKHLFPTYNFENSNYLNALKYSRSCNESINEIKKKTLEYNENTDINVDELLESVGKLEENLNIVTADLRNSIN